MLSPRSPSRQLVAGVATATLLSAARPRPAHAGRKNVVETMSTKQLIEAMKGPVVENAGLSFAVGAASAGALKFTTRIAAMTLGAAFVTIQALAALGVVQVDWMKAGKAVEKYAKINAKDVGKAKEALTRVEALLVNGVPSAAGFAAGFQVGIKYL